MKVHQWARALGYSGLVNQELLLQVEYLAAENRIRRRSDLSIFADQPDVPS